MREPRAYKYFRDYIPYYKFRLKRVIYKGVHYCSWCGTDMKKKGHHGNKILCTRCETKWNDGNKNQAVPEKYWRTI